MGPVTLSTVGAPDPQITRTTIKPIGRIVGADALQFGGWQRLNSEYAKQFGVESPN